MLNKDSVLNAHDICCDPVHWEAEVRKSPVHDHEVSFGHNHSRFVLKLWRDALDEIEQPLTTRCDMRAVLNVVRRPETLSGCIVPLVEERLEGFHDKGPVLFGCSLGYFSHLSCFGHLRFSFLCDLVVLLLGSSSTPPHSHRQPQRLNQ